MKSRLPFLTAKQSERRGAARFPANHRLCGSQSWVCALPRAKQSDLQVFLCGKRFGAIERISAGVNAFDTMRHPVPAPNLTLVPAR
jgi:hypothetical protein